MTSSSTKAQLLVELEELKTKVALLEAEIASLRASGPVIIYQPYSVPGAAPYYPPQVVYPGTAQPPYTIWSGVPGCAPAPVPGITYDLTLPAAPAFPWQQQGGGTAVTSPEWLSSTTSVN